MRMQNVTRTVSLIGLLVAIHATGVSQPSRLSSMSPQAPTANKGFVKGDPYAGFHATFHPFGSESLFPWNVERLKEHGADVTSLFYENREQLATILDFATEKAPFDPRRVNLYVRFGKRTWIVDESGTVLCGKSSARFTKGEFRRLRENIRIWIPELEPEKD